MKLGHLPGESTEKCRLIWCSYQLLHDNCSIIVWLLVSLATLWRMLVGRIKIRGDWRDGIGYTMLLADVGVPDTMKKKSIIIMRLLVKAEVEME